MTRAIVLGIDALDPRIVERIDELPALRSLTTFSELATTTPPETPVAWSAIATGCNPGRYGIYDFLSRNPDNYRPQLNLTREQAGIMKNDYESTMRGVPFWKVLGDEGIRPTVLRWPVNFPPKEMEGRFLSGLGTVDVKGMLNHYKFYTELEEDTGGDGAEKVVPVEPEDGRIETYLGGPWVSTGEEREEAEVPLEIEIKDGGAVLRWDDREAEIEQGVWEGLFRTKFSLHVFAEVSAVFSVYLDSTDPFRMYVSSMQIDPEDQFWRITHPEEYGKELVGEIGLFPTLGMPEDPKVVQEGRLSREPFLERVFQIEDQCKEMFWYEFGRLDEGVLSMTFDTGDRLQHLFWENGIHDGGDIPAEIERYYREMDDFIGEVLERKDSDTPIFVFSDHGFHDFTHQVNLNSWLRKEGYLEADGDDELFAGVDWSSSQCYSLGFTSLFINCEGREKEGTVPEGQRRDLAEEIAGKLKKLKHDGQRVIEEVYLREDIYSGEYMEEAPDIVVGFKPGYRPSWRSAAGGFDSEIIFPNDGAWQGTHLIDPPFVPGVFFTDREINREDPTVCDVAPTILSLFNLSFPHDVEGEPLF